MPKKLYPSNVLEQARTVATAWSQFAPEVNFGTVSAANLTEALNSAADLEGQMQSLELQLTHARNQRDELYSALWDKVKRARSGVKANYGDDSTEYELVGGTRLSERKSPVRRTLPVAE